MKYFIFFLYGCIAIIYSSAAMAIPETGYPLLYKEKVVPFFNSVKMQKLTLDDGVTIAYKTFLNPGSKRNIVILSGWTECMVKYDEIIYDLYQAGFSVFVFDWRGQGNSDRPLPDTQKSYITDYNYYVKDLEGYMDKVVLKQATGEVYPFAHSMGANILSLYLSKHPNAFPRVILSSPMLDIKTHPLPERLTWVICRVMEFFGSGDKYVFGHGRYTGFIPNKVNHSMIRFNKYQNYKKKDSSIIVSGATFSWVRASLEATWYMRDHASELTMPILMLQAGEDLIVDTTGQDYVCSHAKNCTKLFFKDAKHELLTEIDPIRNVAMKTVIDFFMGKTPIGPK